MNNGMNLNPLGLNNRGSNFNSNTKTGIATNANGKALYGNTYGPSKNYDRSNEVEENVNNYNKAYHFNTLDPNRMDLNKKPVEEPKTNYTKFIIIGVVAIALIILLAVLL